LLRLSMAKYLHVRKWISQLDDSTHCVSMYTKEKEEKC